MARLSVEDRLDILDLFARYARCVDAGDADGYADLFTGDGSFTRTNASPAGSGGSGLPPGGFVGSAALRQLVRDLAVLFRGLMRHQLTDVAIDAGSGPDEATGTCYGLITDWREGQGRISMHCTYRTSLVRTAAGWRFRHMTIERLPAS